MESEGRVDALTVSVSPHLIAHSKSPGAPHSFEDRSGLALRAGGSAPPPTNHHCHKRLYRRYQVTQLYDSNPPSTFGATTEVNPRNHLALRCAARVRSTDLSDWSL